MPITSHNRGFSLIEVLIALLVLAIGMLGMASLMLISMKSNQSAYQRTQASLMAYDMGERLRLNSARATSTNAYVVTDSSNPPADPGCQATNCTPAQTSVLDVREWSTALTAQGLTGTVARNGNNYTITTNWQSDDARACAGNSCSFVLRVNL